QRVKSDGAWHTVSWQALGDEVREIALGLIALGRQPGDAIAILSQTRAEWVRADFAILSTGGVTIPVYPSYPGETLAYIVRDSGARTLFVEDEGQLAKAAAVDVPSLDTVVLMQGRASADRGRLRVLDWEGLRAQGRGASSGQALEARLAGIKSSDVATIVYTSGTTGSPKGVVQTHANHLAALDMIARTSGVREGDVHLLFLPLAHSFARMESYLGVRLGLTTAFAESLERLPENLREVSPDFICSVPRVFEKVYAKILTGVAAAPPARQRIFYWALGVGRRASRLERAGRPLPVGLRLQRTVADRLVFAKLRAALGGRLRFCVSGGAPLSAEIAEFFHAAGILVLEGYGLTETCPILTSNHPGAFKFGTVGKPFAGIDLRIAEDGEILARGPNIAQGYYRRQEDTAAVFQPGGWFHTGDVGELDAEGYLRITDRKKDLIKTSGGSYVAPQHIENLLKGDPFVSQALVEGDRRPYPVALITLNPDELAKVARESGVGDRPAADLVRQPAVVERVRHIVDGVNQHLASYAQVKRFAILPADFTQDGGELTPTLKVKRRDVRTK
ncbi:MAG TPA: long-chain fatty acid--CoA ligase, partial [Thermoanaerobaculia bacterium]